MDNRVDKYAYAVGWLSGSITTLLGYRDADGNVPAFRVEDMLDNLRTLVERVGEGVLTKELEEELKNE